MFSLADGVPSPRFGLPLQTVRTFEARAGRKEMLAFAKRQQDLDLKAMAVLSTDTTLGLKLMTQLVNATPTWPRLPSPPTRAIKDIKRRLNSLLAKMEARLER